MPYGWREKIAFLGLVLISARLLSSAGAITLPATKVYMGGEQPPSTPPDVDYVTESSYFLLDNNLPYFDARLTGPSVVNFVNSTVYVRGFASSADLLLRTGVATPIANAGVATFTLDSTSLPWSLDSNGQMAFISHDSTPHSLSTLGIWAGLPGSFELVTRATGAAPDAPGLTLNGLFKGSRSLLGPGSGSFIAFNALLAGPGVGSDSDMALFAGTPGNIQMIARNGSALPGRVNPIYRLDVPRVYPNGRVIFGERSNDIGTTPTHYYSFWSRTPGNSPQLLVNTGDPIPNEISNFNLFFNLESNAAGSFAVAANGSVDLPATPEPTGIWSNRTGSLQKVVRRYDPAPGTGTTSFFNTFGLKTINQSGDVLYFGTLLNPVAIGGTSSGWWVNRSGIDELVTLISHDHGNGMLLSQINADMNDLGTIVFFARIAAGSEDSMWLKLPGADPQLLMKKGDQIDIGGGVLRTIQFISPSFDLNNNNQLLFRPNFGSDGAGLFTISVPEPSSALMGLAMVAAMLRRQLLQGRSREGANHA